jgi:S-adenosylmethionine-diacylglycerol 3-amino-3-carboxypropyl transferase
VQTDLETNWFVWVGLTGEFNHDHPKAVPPYLRAESHRRSLLAPTQVAFHRESLQRMLADAAPGRWSHFSLCDVVDWMPSDAQRQLLQRLARVGGPGAVVLTRSVEGGCVVDRVGLSELYERIEPTSSQASEQERTRLYGRVNVYRVISGA